MKNRAYFSPIIVIGENSEQFSAAVHHLVFMRHEAVNIAIQRDGRVLVTEDFRQRFDIHSALQRAGGKGMPQGMKPAMRNADPME